MKKILLLIVLAVSACTMTCAQNKVDRFFQNVDRAVAQYERSEKVAENVRRALGINRSGRNGTTYDYKTGITKDYYRNKLSAIYCNNCVIKVSETFVQVYMLENGEWVSERFISRDEYGEFWLSGLVCGARENVSLQIINNRERTGFRFWQGGKSFAGETVRASYMQSHKH